jgi:hypothetical protein
MSSPVSVPHVPARSRRVAAIAGAVIALTMVMAPTALAGKPESGPSPNDPVTLDGFCENSVDFRNTTLKGNESLFDPKHNGSQVWMTRGMGVSVVTDLVTGATYTFKGGYRFTVTWAPDGSYRVDGQGTDIIAWYFPGDDSDLGPGLWDIDGHLTEWYAADDSFLRATFSGAATDVCAALEG